MPKKNLKIKLKLISEMVDDERWEIMK